MAREIKESDWRLFRQLRQVALERLCERVLGEVHTATAETDGSFHDRYLRVYELIRDRDKTIGWAFNDPRRSNALILLANMKHEGLLTPDEFARFSEQTREAIENIEYIRRA
jgi:hypothetical protein